MCALKSVLITLPKSLSKTPSGLGRSDGLGNTPTFKFTASALADQRRNDMEDSKSSIKHQLEDSMSLDEDEMIRPELWLRGKKRRLDHLTWEEKLQRKKLKNRVAAQTSRDRKKAKLDELEDTVKALRESNERLTQECSLLRAQNESLVAESERLKCETKANDINRPNSNEESYCSNCRIRVGCTAPTLGSAAGWGSTTGIVTDPIEQKRLDYPEDNDALPPLEELFGELQGDEYIEKLEELAESLLREVTAEVEAGSCRTSEQISLEQNIAKESDDTKRMVGETSENVETSRTVHGINSHNCGRDTNAHQRKPSATVSSPTNSRSTLKPRNTSTDHQLLPDLGNSNISLESIRSEKVSLKHEVLVKEEPVNDMDTVYGTYDEATNCITIIYPDDSVGIQECVQEVSSTMNETSAFDEATSNEKSKNLQIPNNSYENTRNYHLSPAHTITDSIPSPMSMNSEDSENGIVNSYSMECASLSDYGYESHDSPQQSIVREKPSPLSGNTGNVNLVNACSLTDLWHESFSELFPSLV